MTHTYTRAKVSSMDSQLVAELRKCTKRDRGIMERTLLELVRGLDGSGFGIDSRPIPNARNQAIICRDAQGQVLGWLLLYFSRADSWSWRPGTEKRRWEMQLYLRRSARKQGISTELIKQAFAACPSKTIACAVYSTTSSKYFWNVSEKLAAWNPSYRLNRIRYGYYENLNWRWNANKTRLYPVKERFS